jgi:hypothetical protein
VDESGSSKGWKTITVALGEENQLTPSASRIWIMRFSVDNRSLISS